MNNYLFLGVDQAAKDQAILKIKNKIFDKKEAQQFDFDVFYGIKIDLEQLQQSFVQLPVVSSQRLIMIREANKLKPNVQEFLILRPELNI